MTEATLPPPPEMFRAFETRDESYDGIFVTAVRTTGIFCRPACPARKPARGNVEFYPGPQEALRAGYRPCLRCRPLEPLGATPAWLGPLLDEIEANPARRWTDEDLRRRRLDPTRVRRWFQAHHGMTFHAYHRARRLGLALGRIREGEGSTRSGFGVGFESDSGFRDAFRRVLGELPGRSKGRPLLTINRIPTPLGPMVAGATDEGLCLLEFADRDRVEGQLTRVRRAFNCAVAPGEHEHLARAQTELDEYFGGARRAFTVPVVLAGTAFQESVWQALRALRYGETVSYDAIARRIGRPRARRAVGRANGQNRLAVVVPCHRVVGSDGSLTGYGGGLWRKRVLLELECRHTARAPAGAGVDSPLPSR